MFVTVKIISWDAKGMDSEVSRELDSLDKCSEVNKWQSWGLVLQCSLPELLAWTPQLRHGKNLVTFQFCRRSNEAVADHRLNVVHVKLFCWKADYIGLHEEEHAEEQAQCTNLLLSSTLVNLLFCFASFWALCFKRGKLPVKHDAEKRSKKTWSGVHKSQENSRVQMTYPSPLKCIYMLILLNTFVYSKPFLWCLSGKCLPLRAYTALVEDMWMTYIVSFHAVTKIW